MMLLPSVKLSHIYDGEGVTEAVRTKSNMDGMDQLMKIVKKISQVLASKLSRL